MTLDGTRVRSKSEQFIADDPFRHRHLINMSHKYKIRRFPFRPYFYIPAANLYIEHVSNKSYPMPDKEEQFRQGGVLYAKTYERMAEKLGAVQPRIG